jgi:hypothetical protein
VITESGITMEVRAVARNASAPMVITDAGRMMAVMAVVVNANSLMTVTPLPIVMDDRS